MDTNDSPDGSPGPSNPAGSNQPSNPNRSADGNQPSGDNRPSNGNQSIGSTQPTIGSQSTEGIQSAQASQPTPYNQPTPNNQPAHGNQASDGNQLIPGPQSPDSNDLTGPNRPNHVGQGLQWPPGLGPPRYPPADFQLYDRSSGESNDLSIRDIAAPPPGDRQPGGPSLFTGLSQSGGPSNFDNTAQPGSPDKPEDPNQPSVSSNDGHSGGLTQFPDFAGNLAEDPDPDVSEATDPNKDGDRAQEGDSAVGSSHPENLHPPEDPGRVNNSTQTDETITIKYSPDSTSSGPNQSPTLDQPETPEDTGSPGSSRPVIAGKSVPLTSDQTASWQRHLRHHLLSGFGQLPSAGTSGFSSQPSSPSAYQSASANTTWPSTPARSAGHDRRVRFYDGPSDLLQPDESPHGSTSPRRPEPPEARFHDYPGSSPPSTAGNRADSSTSLKDRGPRQSPSTGPGRFLYDPLDPSRPRTGQNSSYHGQAAASQRDTLQPNPNPAEYRNPLPLRKSGGNTSLNHAYAEADRNTSAGQSTQDEADTLPLDQSTLLTHPALQHQAPALGNPRPEPLPVEEDPDAITPALNSPPSEAPDLDDATGPFHDGSADLKQVAIKAFPSASPHSDPSDGVHAPAWPPRARFEPIAYVVDHNKEGYSRDIGRTFVLGGRYYVLFGDTFCKKNGEYVGTVDNTYALIEDPRQPTRSKYLDFDEHGRPKQFLPYTQEEKAEIEKGAHRAERIVLWGFGGVTEYKKGKGILFNQKGREYKKSGRTVSECLGIQATKIKVDKKTGRLLVNRPTDLLFSGDEPLMGSFSTLRIDPFIYLFGGKRQGKDDNKNAEIVLGRVLIKEFRNRKAYTFFDGKDWRPDWKDAVTMFKDIPQGMVLYSNFFGSSHPFVMVGCSPWADSSIWVGVASAITGPWYTYEVCKAKGINGPPGGFLYAMYPVIWNDKPNTIPMNVSEQWPGGVVHGRLIFVAYKTKGDTTKADKILGRLDGADDAADGRAIRSVKGFLWRLLIPVAWVVDLYRDVRSINRQWKERRAQEASERLRLSCQEVREGRYV